MTLPCLFIPRHRNLAKSRRALYSPIVNAFVRCIWICIKGEMVQNLGLRSFLTASGQRELFIVLHPLWYGDSFFFSFSWGLLLCTPISHFNTVLPHLDNFRLITDFFHSLFSIFCKQKFYNSECPSNFAIHSVYQLTLHFQDVRRPLKILNNKKVLKKNITELKNLQYLLIGIEGLKR
jgi:hypothetical protein